MSELKGTIPLLISFIFTLILTALGVPSPVDIAILYFIKLQEFYPTPQGNHIIIALRLFGWFLTIFLPLSIIIQFIRGKYL